MISRLVAALSVVLCVLPGCGASAVADVSTALDARSRGDTKEHAEHFRELLWQALAKDAHVCLPSVADTFAPPAASWPTRQLRGTMPHYDWFEGPMSYRVGPDRASGGSQWLVRVNIAVAPTSADLLELPDCALASELDGAVVCNGTPYELAPGVEACPTTGRFEAPATRHNQRVLLQRWSRDVETYFNRDAEHYGLPVRYDFELFLADDGVALGRPVDVTVPLAATCARTPYFVALRSGWSIPVLAHEIGHFLGLLDEYEALSGITSLYPKTPFQGSEGSRMGLSMKIHTRLLPVHHYLILRRYHCARPLTKKPIDLLLGGRALM